MSGCGMRLRGLLLVTLGGIIVLGILSQAPLFTGAPNPFDSAAGQWELRILTIGACLLLGFGWNDLR